MKEQYTHNGTITVEVNSGYNAIILGNKNGTTELRSEWSSKILNFDVTGAIFTIAIKNVDGADV